MDLRAMDPDQPRTVGTPEPVVSVVPEGDLLPPLAGTERLTEGARPRNPWRDELRRIPNAHNVVNVVSAWAQVIAVLWGAVWLSHPVVWVIAFVLMGRSFALLAILAHEAAHRLLFSKRAINDFVGRWLLAYPAFVPFDLYRRVHFSHHRDEMGPEEPDLNLYQGYPIPADSLRRKLTRDALGISGWKNLKGLFRGLRAPRSRPVALRIIAAQVVVLAVFTAVGRPELYLLLWFAPYMTVWRVINRLRAIAEHAGMIRSSDRRQTTHHVHQSLWARFWFVPYYTGWHLAHHVDMGVPMRNLPTLHDELVAVGWITPELEYPTYRALWKRLASG